MEGMLTNIQRFSIHDGPGIRTTVFLKGCSLHCLWCHNPETLSHFKQIQFYKNKCIGCGACFKACPVNASVMMDGIRKITESKCTACGRCVEVCPSEALAFAGKTMSVEEIMNVLKKDMPFYKNSNGGVTFSGGEPLLQIRFLTALLLECKKSGLHTAIETAGNVQWKCFEQVIPYTDLFLYDLKHLDEKKHIACTGKSNRLILENISKLSEAGADIIIRVPIIPDMNDSIEHITELAGFIRSLKRIEYVELLPFHSMARSKYESLGETFTAEGISIPKTERMELLASVLRQAGIQVHCSSTGHQGGE